MPWTIDSPSFSGDSFEEAGISSCVAIFNASGGDSCSLFIPGNSDGTKPFDDRDDVTITAPDSTVFFRGYVRSCQRVASGSSEGFEVLLDGKMKILDRIPYLQRIRISGASPTYAHVSECNLGFDSDGNRLNSSDTLSEILAFAATSGSGLSEGSILSGVDVTLPQMEAQDMTCMEAMRRVLAFHPDAVFYFDHAANTVNVKRPGGMSAVTKASEGDGSGITRVEIDRTKRFPVDGVTIQWKTTTTLDDQTEITVVTDSAGTPAPAADVVVFTIALQGKEVITQSQECITEDLPTQASDFTGSQWNAFLAKHFKEWKEISGITTSMFTVYFADQNIDTGSKVGLGTPPSDYPRMLTGGAIPLWQSGISAAPTRLTIKIRPGADIASNPELYALFDKGKEKMLSLDLNVTGTDALTTTYRTVTGFTEGEEPIEGLAADYYAAMNADAPSGGLTKVSEEPDITMMPGKRITLTGDFPATTATIQQTTVDVFAGRVTVIFGPTSVRTPPEFVSAMRAGNKRSRLQNPGGGERTSATPSGRDIQGTGHAVKSTEPAVPVKSKKWFTCEQASGVSGGAVTIKCNTGRVLGAQVDEDPGYPQLPAHAQIYEFEVAENDITGVAHGDNIYLKLHYTSGSSQTSTEGDLEGILLNYIWLGCTSATTQKGSDSLDFFYELDGSNLYVYILLAKVTIASSIVTIDQKTDGLVTAPTLSANWFDPGDYPGGLPYQTPP